MKGEKLIRRFFHTKEKLIRYFEISDCESIDDYRNCKFFDSGEVVRFIIDGEEYSHDIIRNNKSEKDGFIIYMFDSDFGDGEFWAVFDVNNRLTEEEFYKVVDYD